MFNDYDLKKVEKWEQEIMQEEREQEAAIKDARIQNEVEEIQEKYRPLCFVDPEFIIERLGLHEERERVKQFVLPQLQEEWATASATDCM